MSLLKRILDRLNDATAAPMPMPQPVNRPALQAPAEDDDIDMLTPDETGVIQLDEVYSTIDYVDAKGNGSRRRITMRSITGGSHGPILKAICHERRALRAFRCDRIECFIDEDGIVTDCDEFFTDILRVDLSAFTDPATKPNAKVEEHEPATIYPFGKPGSDIRYDPVTDLRQKLSAPVSVLVAVARCDGLHDTEVAAILNYIEDEAFAPDRAGQFVGLSAQDVDSLEPTIRRMRPSRDSLKKRLDYLNHMTEPQLDRFHRAVRKVVHADGQITAEEIQAYSIIEDWKVCQRVESHQ
jgi:hypothetical protein